MVGRGGGCEMVEVDGWEWERGEGGRGGEGGEG